MRRKSSRYKIYVDISGTIKKTKDDIFVGCILLNDNFKGAFREKFYRNFPSLRSFQKKGSSLCSERLKKVIQFMDNTNVKMSVVILQRHIIKKTKNLLKSKIRGLKKITGEVSIKDYEERLMGLAYFNAIQQLVWASHQYDCYFCMESQFKIQECLVCLDRISYKNGYSLRPSCTPRRIEHMLKFSDFVASAGRRIDKYILHEFKNLKYNQYEPSEEELNIAFCLARREKSKRLIL